MNQTISVGNQPVVRASRALRMIDVRKKCASALALRQSLNPSACLTVAVIATLALFFSLGAMNVTAIIISGITALTTAAIAPTSRKGGQS